MNIDKIEVFNNGFSFIMFPKDKMISLSNKSFSIEEEEIKEFLRIIRTWDKEYINNSYTDGIMFNVKVYYDGKIDEMKGIRAVPDNYEEFNAYVRKVYDRR
jgi:hypothetical protein